MTVSLPSVPVGAVLRRAYYAVPKDYTTGQSWPATADGWRAACRAANTRADLARDAVLGGGRVRHRQTADYAEQCAKARAFVDLRWDMAFPQGGGADVAVERTNVRHLDEAHWDRVGAPLPASR